jgi:(S)-ureidoglycine aminohydrolase
MTMHSLGHTRSSHQRDHLLHTPDTFVRTPQPGLIGGHAVVHIGPQLGAAFTMMTVELGPQGTLREGPAQRLLYVLAGELTLAEPSSTEPHPLAAGSYAYLPQDHTHTLTAMTAARILLFDKPFFPLDPAHSEQLDEPCPQFLLGQESDLQPTPLDGDPDLQVRALLPASLAFDFAVNTMTYAPGASLAQVEVHYMEHGLLMLEGGGIYRLGDRWYPTQAGDAIWMGPFCPQWFGALGRKPAKYILYKDFNRHPSPNRA